MYGGLGRAKTIGILELGDLMKFGDGVVRRIVELSHGMRLGVWVVLCGEIGCLGEAWMWGLRTGGGEGSRMSITWRALNGAIEYCLLVWALGTHTRNSA